MARGPKRKPARQASRSRRAKPAPRRPARGGAKTPRQKARPGKARAAVRKPAGKSKAMPAAARQPKPKPPPPKPAPPKVAVGIKPVPPPKPAPPPPPEKPRKPRKPEITPREIAQIRRALEEQKSVFMREFTDIEEGAFNISQSEMSGEVSFDEEYADAGSFTFEREKELSIGHNIRDLLDKVQHALDAIERKTYGLCENCGDPISKARLQALPYSTMCIKCKQREERTR